jgi:hypothetical protein
LQPQRREADFALPARLRPRWDAADRFIIALNFSDQDHFVTLPFSVEGAWEDLLSGLSVNVTSFRLGVTLTSNWGRVFMKR